MMSFQSHRSCLPSSRTSTFEFRTKKQRTSHQTQRRHLLHLPSKRSIVHLGTILTVVLIFIPNAINGDVGCSPEQDGEQCIQAQKNEQPRNQYIVRKRISTSLPRRWGNGLGVALPPPGSSSFSEPLLPVDERDRLLPFDDTRNNRHPKPEVIDRLEEDLYTLRAGHSCNSTDQCDNKLRCEMFNVALLSSVPFSSSFVSSSVNLYSPSSTLTTITVESRIPSDGNANASSTSPIMDSDKSHLLSVNGKHVCSRVQCEEDCKNLTKELIQCPYDSYVIERYSDDHQCCIQTCKCLPDVCNKRKNCTGAYRLKRRGDLYQPGNCCDEIECLHIDDVSSPDPSNNEIAKPIGRHNKAGGGVNKESDGNHKPCYHLGQQYVHGMAWNAPECMRCNCTFGVTVCDKTKNCPLPHGCAQSDNQDLDDGQCCPKCQGCMHDGAYYEHGKTWTQADGCEQCTCLNSRQKCHADMCRPVTCADGQRPEKKFGECCLECVCSLSCPNGFKHDIDGNDICECNSQYRPEKESPEYELQKELKLGEEQKQQQSQHTTISATLFSADIIVKNNQDKQRVSPEDLNARSDSGQLTLIIIVLTVCVFIIVFGIVCYVYSKKATRINREEPEYSPVNKSDESDQQARNGNMKPKFHTINEKNFNVETSQV